MLHDSVSLQKDAAVIDAHTQLAFYRIRRPVRRSAAQDASPRHRYIGGGEGQLGSIRDRITLLVEGRNETSEVRTYSCCVYRPLIHPIV